MCVVPQYSIISYELIEAWVVLPFISYALYFCINKQNSFGCIMEWEKQSSVFTKKSNNHFTFVLRAYPNNVYYDHKLNTINASNKLINSLVFVDIRIISLSLSLCMCVVPQNSIISCELIEALVFLTFIFYALYFCINKQNSFGCIIEWEKQSAVFTKHLTIILR